MEVGNINSGVKIKVEKNYEIEEKSSILREKKFAAIPEMDHISVGEIKIEDGFFRNESEEKDFDIECDEGSGSVKIKYEAHSDEDMSSGEENSSSAASKWNKEDHIPTTSQRIKKEKPKLKSKKEKVMKIKKETNNDSDSDPDDIPSDDEREFLSDVSGGEEFLSDGDENSIDNQNLTVDNKPVVLQLIAEYHKRPLLWFKELSSDMSASTESQLFRGINNVLSKKFNMKFNVNRTKALLKSLCTQYVADIERQLKENEETIPESSSLWFYDKLFFLKDDVENDVKLKLEKTMSVLNENILADLIDIYKNYDDLWDTDKSTFPNRKKRHETMQSMCLEIKNKLKLSLNTFKLKYQLINLHEKLKQNKKWRFACEMDKKKYKPLFSFISKCEFLENHQEPFKCYECTEVLATQYKFRQHKAQHDGTPPFKCNICGKICNIEKTLYYHQRIHTGVNYNCSICGKKFSCPSLLKSHIKYAHTSLTCGKIFSCNVCGKSFDRLIKLGRHKKCVHLQEPIQCKICGQTYKNKLSLKAHKSTHRDKNYDCSMCEKRFNESYKLKKHMRLVHTLTCYICGEVYNNYFSQHMSTHGIKHFDCDICGKGFEDEHKVKRHKSNVHVQKEV